MYLLGSRNSPEATFPKESADVLQNIALSSKVGRSPLHSFGDEAVSCDIIKSSEAMFEVQNSCKYLMRKWGFPLCSHSRNLWVQNAWSKRERYGMQISSLLLGSGL